MRAFKFTCESHTDQPQQSLKTIQIIKKSSIHSDGATEIAIKIFQRVMTHRRLIQANEEICDANLCLACLKPHLEKIISYIKQKKPITFVLPAFPGKSPNLSKVLGDLPDKGEELALSFLNKLCENLKDIYAPGAKIILCSDGRVFSDIIGIKESSVSDYQDAIQLMIEELNLVNLSIMSLDNLYEEKNFTFIRDILMETYGHSLTSLKEKILRGSKGAKNQDDKEAHRIYCGITRFLVEDATFLGQTKSRTLIQKESKIKAHEVIRRSNAWSNLIEEKFPEALRLSIHPQSCGSKKIGIKLLANENWVTPWHGVAVNISNVFVLMKRWEAEKMSAELIRDSEGRPSHYKLR